MVPCSQTCITGNMYNVVPRYERQPQLAPDLDFSDFPREVPYVVGEITLRTDFIGASRLKTNSPKSRLAAESGARRFGPLSKRNARSANSNPVNLEARRFDLAQWRRHARGRGNPINPLGLRAVRKSLDNIRDADTALVSTCFVAARCCVRVHSF